MLKNWHSSLEVLSFFFRLGEDDLREKKGGGDPGIQRLNTPRPWGKSFSVFPYFSFIWSFSLAFSRVARCKLVSRDFIYTHFLGLRLKFNHLKAIS